MIKKIGVKPYSGSLNELKKELLFFDQIHYFPEDLIIPLSTLLIPDDPSQDDFFEIVKSALDQTDKLFKTGKCSDPKVNQFLSDYSILTEKKIILPHDEKIIVDLAKQNEKSFKEIIETDNVYLNDWHNSNHLINLINSNTDFFNENPSVKSKLLKDEILSKDLFKSLLNQEDSHNEFALREIFSEIIARLHSMTLNQNSQDIYIPILERISDFKSHKESKNRDSNKQLILHTVLNSIPLPDFDTPIQEVLDFRNDNEAKSHILALNNWIIDLSKGDLNQKEISQKIEYLVNEYDKFIKIQKLKFSYSKLEIAVTSIAEITENLVKFKFSDTAKIIFSLFKDNYTIMDSEMKAPGKEVAFISKVRGKFGK
jgi:hypothetical protein